MKKILLSLFIISLAVRLYFLFFGFNSITNDEADYYLTSYLFAKTGSDQFGHVVFFSSGFLNAISSVPVYIGALIWHIFPIKSIVIARLPFAILNSFTPVLFFSLVYYFSKNILFSTLAFAIMNFSPWFSHLSATAAFDSPLSLLFFLVAVNVLCYFKKPVWLKYILFICFNFLAFNSYMGFKTIFPLLLMFFLLLYFFSQKNKLNKKQILLAVFFTFIVFISFLLISLKSQGGNLFTDRASKTVVFLDKNTLENTVWYANLTTNNRVIRKLFNNSVIASSQLFLSKYSNAFNPAIYFFGEPHVIYGLRIMGLFFATDALLFLIGILVGFKLLKKQIKMLILGLLFLGPIPAALQIEGLTVALRGIFLLPAYSLIIASGYITVFKYIKNRTFYKALILLFLFNFISFLGLYQYRIKILSSESWGATQKLIIEDLFKYKNSKVHVYTNEEKSFFVKYGMYNKIENPFLFKKQIMSGDKNKNTYENLTIHFSCEDLIKQNNFGYFLFDVKRCPSEYKQKIANFTIIKEYYGQDKTGELLYILAKRI